MDVDSEVSPIQQHRCSGCLQPLLSSTAANAHDRGSSSTQRNPSSKGQGWGRLSGGKQRLSCHCRVFLQANPSGKQRQNLKAEKQSGFGNPKAASPGEGSRRVWLQGCCSRGASAPPLHRCRHRHCRTRRDRSKHTACQQRETTVRLNPADFSQHPLLTPRISGCR